MQSPPPRLRLRAPARGWPASGGMLRAFQSRRSFFDLHELPAEASLDAQVAVRHGMVQRRKDANDRAVLLMNRKIAADAAIRAYRIRVCLARFVPLARRAQIVFRLEHQRARGTHRDAVAA